MEVTDDTSTYTKNYKRLNKPTECLPSTAFRVGYVNLRVFQAQHPSVLRSTAPERVTKHSILALITGIGFGAGKGFESQSRL